MMRTFPADKPLISMIAPLFWFDDQGRLREQTDLGIRTTKVDDWQESRGWSPWFVCAERNTQEPARNRFLSGQFVFTLGGGRMRFARIRSIIIGARNLPSRFAPIPTATTCSCRTTWSCGTCSTASAPPRRHWEHGHGGSGAQEPSRIRAFAQARLQRRARASSAATDWAPSAAAGLSSASPAWT